MSRQIRTIRPDILIEDESAAALSDAAWRLWVGLRLIADDFGSARAGEKFLAGRIWQNGVPLKRVIAAREELANVGRVAVYTAGGELFVRLADWDDEQRIDRRSQHTRNPAPDYPFRNSSAGASQIEVEIIRDVRSIFAAGRGESPPVAASRRGKQQVAARARTDARGRDPDLGSGVGSGVGSPQPPVVEVPIVQPRVYDVPRCYAVAFARGAERGSGAPVTAPTSGAELDKLVAAIDAHARRDGKRIDGAGEICEWLEAQAEAFARHTDGQGNRPKMTAWAFAPWLDGRHRAPVIRPGLQRPDPTAPGWIERNIHRKVEE